MPFSITCPSCSAKLKSAAAIPLGRKVPCPKCKQSFVVSEDNMVEVAESKTMTPAAPSKSVPATKAPPPRKPSPVESNPFGDLGAAPLSKSKDEGDEEEERPQEAAY